MIIRLQLNLKSYIHSDNDNSGDSHRHCSSGHRLSYQYYLQKIDTDDGFETTLSLNNFELKEEFFILGNKVSRNNDNMYVTVIVIMYIGFEFAQVV